MRWSATFLLAAVVCVASTPAYAGLTLGANLGFALVDPDEGKNTEIVGIPNQRTVPGLRLGWAGKNPANQIFLDLGYTYSDVEQNSGSETIATLNYQRTFKAEQALAFYVTAGAGMVRQSAKSAPDVPSPYDLSAMSSLFGGGVGVRRRIAGGHGALRGEIRYDERTEGKDGDVLLVQQAGFFQVKVGFDILN